jgi:hypothetical protein
MINSPGFSFFVNKQQARQDFLDLLYRLDGRVHPVHPLHGLYTGLCSKKNELMKMIAADQALKANGYGVSVSIARGCHVARKFVAINCQWIDAKKSMVYLALADDGTAWIKKEKGRKWKQICELPPICKQVNN